MNDLIFFSILFSIDATEHNERLGRLVNDGDGVYEPVNCVMKSLPYDPSCTSSPPICLFALKTIHPGDELRYDYGNPELIWRKVISNTIYQPINNRKGRIIFFLHSFLHSLSTVVIDPRPRGKSGVNLSFKNDFSS